MPTRNTQASDVVFEAPPEKVRRLRELQARAGELRRNRPRRWATPGDLARHCEPGTLQTAALDLIDASAVAMLDGTAPRQLINAPPQTGKSQRVSRWTPLWLLTCDPKLRIVIVSAEKELAVRWGRQIKRDLEAHPDLGLTLMQDSQAAGRWETAEGGGLFCTGVAAGTTGRPIDCVSADTLIECEHGKITAAEAFERGVTRLLAYDHTTGRPVWRDVEAARRIPGRQVVEVRTTAGRSITCTPDHRVYTSRGYLPAERLQVGDSLVAVVAAGRVPMRQAAPRSEVDGAQGSPQRARRDLLLEVLHGFGVLDREPHTVLSVRCASPSMSGSDMLGRVRTVAPGAYHSRVSAVSRTVPAEVLSERLLHSSLRGRRTLAADDRQGQLALQNWDELRALVPVDASAGSRARRSSLRGMLGTTEDDLSARWSDRGAVGAGHSSHRRGSVEQPPGEPDHAVCDVSRCAPQVETDTVAVVLDRGNHTVDVYDFQVAGTRNFFGDGLLVHNCLIVDDPIKDRAQAESKTMRDRVWDFWENDAGQRARKSLIMSTRWHTADLHGQLLEKEPGRWSSLSIPAIAETLDDPLGRQVGEEMQSANPELHPPGYYSERQKLVSPYVWSSLFQQRPTAAEGGIFKRGDWRYWSPLHDGERQLLRLEQQQFDLTDCSRFITIDLATSTRTSADFTVAAAWAITLSGDVVLLDRVRARVPEIDHAAFLAPLRQRWLTPYDVTHIESRMFGTTLVYALGRAGVPVAELDADTDKLTRALPAAGLVRQHRVWLPRTAPWLDEWLDEHADFPKATHDDQVDVLAYAARVAIAHWLAPEPAEVTEPRRIAGRLGSDDLIDLMTEAM